MKRFALLFVALALVVSACGAGDAELAATVNGTDFTVGDVNALVYDSGETMSKEEFAQFLGFLIQWDIVVRAAEAEYGISIGDDEVAEAATGIYETQAEQGVTFEEFLEANGVSEDFVNKFAQLQLIEGGLRDALLAEIEDPTEEELEAQREASYDNLTEVCVSHILVETEEESLEVVQRLDAGEEFADLAAELSTDPGTGPDGGDLGCWPPTRYVPEFMDATLEAEIDVPFGPVETEFGFHTLLVSDRTFPTDEELPTDDEIIESLKSAELPSALSNWVGDIIDSADVDVNEKFGTWQSNPPSVIPPGDDTDTTPTTEANPDDATTTTVAEPTEEETTTTVGE